MKNIPHTDCSCKQCSAYLKGITDAKLYVINIINNRIGQTLDEAKEIKEYGTNTPGHALLIGAHDELQSLKEEIIDDPNFNCWLEHRGLKIISISGEDNP